MGHFWDNKKKISKFFVYLIALIDCTRNAEYDHIHIQTHVCVLSDSILAEASVLPSHGHAPYCHVLREQKELIFLLHHHMPNNSVLVH
jgi:hypothetical protein